MKAPRRIVWRALQALRALLIVLVLACAILA